MSSHHTRSNSPSKGSPIGVRPDIPSGDRAFLLKFAELPAPSICPMHALARLVTAQDDGDRRAVEHLRDELARNFQWVVRPPALPPDRRGR